MSQRVLRIPAAHWQQMHDHVRDCIPNEACGLLGGAADSVSMVLPVTNVEASPVRYRMDPQEQIHALYLLEDRGVNLIGVYHSHPSGPSYPSATDQEPSASPELIQLIWSSSSPGWGCRAFLIDESGAQEISVLLTD